MDELIQIEILQQEVRQLRNELALVLEENRKLKNKKTDSVSESETNNKQSKSVD